MFSSLLTRTFLFPLHRPLGWLLNMNDNPKIYNFWNSMKEFSVRVYEAKLKNTQPYHFCGLKMHTFFLLSRH